MLSKKDIAIRENILKQQTVDTFFAHVLIDDEYISDMGGDHCDTCYESALDDSCHVWQAAKSPKGYGLFHIYCKELNKPIVISAHRFAYAYAFGIDELPNGVKGGDGNQLVVNHTCHNRACVNPMHLEVITQNENLSIEKRKPRKPNDAIIADNLEDFMEQIRNTENE